MGKHGAALAVAGCLLAVPASAGTTAKRTDAGVAAVPERCLVKAAAEWQVPVDALRLILHVERGRVGECSPNDNGTQDCGPGQINSIWYDRIAAGRVPPSTIQKALTDDPCYNVRVSAWILRKEIEKVGWANFWTAVGNYHSRTPEFHAAYLRRIVEAARTLNIDPSRKKR
jgi:hypothetical protein